MRSLNIPYNEKLDHLRFLAALAVLMFHAEWSSVPKPSIWIPLLHEGHVGVQLFMVISGFILATIAYGREIHILRFYGNRILRIYPLFIVVVSLGYFLRVDNPTSAGIDYLLAMLPISNLYRYAYGPFGGSLWSVAVELQFYLIFPFLILAIDRYGEKFAWLLIFLMLVLRTLVFLYSGTIHHVAYFTIFGAMDSFVIGILAARFHLRKEFRVGAWVPFVILLVANLLIYILFGDSFFHVDYRSGRPASASRLWIVWPTVEALLFASLLITYLKCSGQLPFSSLIANFGRWSYSFYVWHWMMLVLVLKVTSSYGLHPYVVAAVFVLPLTMALSALTYYVIERPFLDMRMKYTEQRPG